MHPRSRRPKPPLLRAAASCLLSPPLPAASSAVLVLSALPFSSVTGPVAIPGTAPQGTAPHRTAPPSSPAQPSARPSAASRQSLQLQLQLLRLPPEPHAAATPHGLPRYIVIDTAAVSPHLAPPLPSPHHCSWPAVTTASASLQQDKKKRPFCNGTLQPFTEPGWLLYLHLVACVCAPVCVCVCVCACARALCKKRTSPHTWPLPTS